MFSILDLISNESFDNLLWYMAYNNFPCPIGISTPKF